MKEGNNEMRTNEGEKMKGDMTTDPPFNQDGLPIFIYRWGSFSSSRGRCFPGIPEFKKVGVVRGRWL
jgi:hypothetical protein